MKKFLFIGDKFNHIAMSNNNFNLTSLLSLMCLIKLINFIKKKLNLSNQTTFFSIILISIIFKFNGFAKTIFMDMYFISLYHFHIS